MSLNNPENSLLIKIPAGLLASFNDILEQAAEQFSFNVTVVQVDDFCTISIFCPDKSFAEAYYHLGALCGKLWADILHPTVGHVENKLNQKN